MEPIYTLSSCKSAYQLRWSLALFPTTPVPPSHEWLLLLNEALESDGIRVLEASQSSHDALLLLLSTQPHIVPTVIVQRVKGRLQYLLRTQHHLTWRRNFRLTSVGDAKLQTVENYVATQLNHHIMGSELSQQRLADFAWEDKRVDLATPIHSSHGQYVLCLHYVFVHSERWSCATPAFLENTRQGIHATMRKYSCCMSRLSILSDHLHMTLRLSYDLSPGELAVSCMNNVAYFHGMLRLFKSGFYAGTIGAYDMNAVRK